MNASVSKTATINYYDTDPLSKERDQTGISIDLNHLSTWSLSQEYPNEVSDFSKKFRADTIVKITDISFNPISTPLDLRATPLPDPMSTEVGLHHQQSPQRSVFKMNPDFWQQARGPPALPAPPTNNGQQSTTPTGQPSSGINSNPPTPNNTIAAPNTPDSKMMTDKLVNELQIFMHKSAMQLQARDLVPIGGHRSEVKPHQCQQCLKSFSSNHQLVQHIRVHTGEKPYKCSYCDRRFKQLSHVQQHTRLHTGERPYKCHLPECGRAFIQLSNLQQHLRNHDAQVERAKNRPFHCNICGKGFATESSLRTHTSKVGGQHAALIGGPNATSCPICHKLFLGGEALMEHMKHTHKDPNASGVATKRRTANHPCPVCGKHYVNEGSLRKHLACHPETSQFTQSLRMWPCSVCQAVFTHESGLLSHMEHMRMDPKHQFAAQYVLSRAAAERRERESLLSAAIAASSGGLGLGGGHSSMCASPSAHSDSSSGGGRLSSTGSEPGGIMNNNNNNNNNKISELLARNNGIQQYGEDLHNASRMAAMAAIVGQSSGVGSGLGSPGSSLGVDQSTAVAVQQAAVNLAAAMRMGAQGLGGLHSPNGNHHQGNNQGNTSPQTNSLNEVTAVQAQAAMNAAMRAASMADLRSMDVAMRSSMAVDSAMRESMTMNHHSSHQNHQNTEAAALRMHQAEALLRTQAEAALRLAVSQAAAVAATGGGGDMRHHNMGSGHNNNSGNSNNDELRDALRSPYRNQMGLNHHNNQVSTDLSEALRLQEQRLEQALRLHGGDPRALGFSLSGSSGLNSHGHSQQNQHQSN